MNIKLRLVGVEILLVAIILVAGSKILTAQSLESFVPDFKNTDMYKIQEDRKNVWKDVPLEKQKGWKQYKRWEAFWAPRLWPNGDFISASKILSENYNKLQIEKQDGLQSDRWTQVGPFAPPQKYGAYTSLIGVGRVNMVRFHPTDPNILWIGSASGGVWRSKDKGKTWETFPFTQFMSLGVSDIAISPTDPNTVYVATGDADGTLGSAMYCYSVGIIKTTDGGKTWDVTGLAKQLPEKYIISRLLISPTNPNTVIAATTSGIMKTTDGGETWTCTQNGNFRDMEVKPDDQNTVYASTSGRASTNSIYKSANFGDTWTLKKEIREAGRIQLAVSSAAPEYVYALCSQYYHNGFHSFMLSDNAGDKFEVQCDSSKGNYLNWAGYDLGTSKGQSYYDLCLAVSPSNAANVILGGIECYRSANYGTSWRQCSNVGTSRSDVHVDMHDLVYNPLDSLLYLCSDGGIYVSGDDGQSWSNLNDGIAITQYYRFNVSSNSPDHIICGAQDNGTSMYYNGSWYQLYGGDGMDCAIDPKDEKHLFASVYYGSILASNDNGKTFYSIFDNTETEENADWTAPLVIDPNNSEIIYVGHTNIWKNKRNGSGAWNKISDFTSGYTLDVISVAPSDSKYIYAVALNNLYKTSDGGSTWTLITSASNAITSVTISPTDPNLIWYTLSGFDRGNKVFMYDGTTRTNLSGNLPNVPVNAGVYQKGTSDRIYIGTDIGVFYSDGRSNNWTNMNDNLPNVIIDDMQISEQTTPAKLYVATFGCGVWKSDVITCDVMPIQLSEDSTISKCPTEFAEVTASDGFTDYVWSNGTTGKTLRTIEEGTYSVTAKNGDCIARSKTINIEDIITSAIGVSVVNSQPACIGDTIELNATMGYKSYLWSTGDTTKRIKTSESGDFWVIGMKGADCDSYSDTVHIEFYPYPAQPTISILGDTLVCNDSATYYQWYLAGEKIKSATKKTYVPDTSGIYTVCIKNEGRCEALSDEITYNKSAVDGDITTSVAVFPNPSKGSFKLDLRCQPGDVVSYTVSNTAGKELFKSEHISGTEYFSTTIDLSEYADGAYILALKTNGKLKIINLIKQ